MLSYEDMYGRKRLIVVILARDFASSGEKCIEIIRELEWKEGVRAFSVDLSLWLNNSWLRYSLRELVESHRDHLWKVRS